LRPVDRENDRPGSDRREDPAALGEAATGDGRHLVISRVKRARLGEAVVAGDITHAKVADDLARVVNFSPKLPLGRSTSPMCMVGSESRRNFELRRLYVLVQPEQIFWIVL
jgi:hypothetical protein